MGTNFDAAELRKVKSDAFARAFDEALKTKSTGTALDNAEDAAVLAVAAHVRAQTLREAAGVCERNRPHPGDVCGCGECAAAHAIESELNRLAAKEGA
jgi:hypothetical protein